MKYYEAFEYDFNDGHGEVVVHRDDLTIKAGDQIILVSIEGQNTPGWYDGFGCLVTVTGFWPAHKQEYVRVRTDYRR